MICIVRLALRDIERRCAIAQGHPFLFHQLFESRDLDPASRMSMTAAKAFARENPRARKLSISNRLQRFAWRHRPAVADLTARHSRLGDLAFSFPGLLFALAVPQSNFDPSSVIDRTIDGASLRELAKLAAIPLWTRHLPPEAFQRPVPVLPDSELFRRQIANHWPRNLRTASELAPNSCRCCLLGTR